MARPPCCRHVSAVPGACVFKPAGIRACDLEEVVITLDQFEALRLADFEGLYQEEAAARMNVSRPTFGRILEAAHRSVAEALTLGKALRIEGGAVCRSTEAQAARACEEDSTSHAQCPRCQADEGARRDAATTPGRD